MHAIANAVQATARTRLQDRAAAFGLQGAGYQGCVGSCSRQPLLLQATIPRMSLIGQSDGPGMSALAPKRAPDAPFGIFSDRVHVIGITYEWSSPRCCAFRSSIGKSSHARPFCCPNFGGTRSFDRMLPSIASSRNTSTKALPLPTRASSSSSRRGPSNTR